MMLSEEVVIDSMFSGSGGVHNPILLIIIFWHHTDQVVMILLYLPELAVNVEVLRTELDFSCVCGVEEGQVRHGVDHI